MAPNEVMSVAKLSEHFDDSEFRCRCCRQLPEGGMSPELIRRLEGLRAAVGGKPLRITSGYRCPTHNAAVGARSQHVLGTAADVLAAGIGVDKLAEAAERVGFGGIGRYPKQGFVHVDVRAKRARW